MHAKFKVRIFSHFGTDTIKRPKIYGVTSPLRSLDIQGLAATKGRRLNCEPL